MSLGTLLSLAGAGASTIANVKANREQDDYEKKKKREETQRNNEEAKRRRMEALSSYIGGGDLVKLSNLKYDKPQHTPGGPNLSGERTVSALGNLLAQYGPQIANSFTKKV
jgi:hypothetical protein